MIDSHYRGWVLTTPYLLVLGSTIIIKMGIVHLFNNQHLQIYLQYIFNTLLLIPLNLSSSPRTLIMVLGLSSTIYNA